MIFVSLALLGLGAADLIRWSPARVSKARAVASVAGGVGLNAAIGALSGIGADGVVAVAAVTAVVLGVWASFDLVEGAAGYALAWILGVLVFAFALSGSADLISGPLRDWYSHLDFSFVDSVTIDQFLLGVSAGFFLLATGNRLVRLLLEAAGTPVLDTGKAGLRGGRVLGPMERLIVAAMVIAGDPAGAAIVIAAKGLLRLPEIRSSAEQQTGQTDQVTEYFLIGTFGSLILAAAMAQVVLAAG